MTSKKYIFKNYL